MARGFGARETTVAPKPGRLNIPAKDKDIEDGVRALKSDKAAEASFFEFLNHLSHHISGGVPVEAVKRAGNDWGLRKANKINKLMLAEAAKKLPPSVRALVELDKKEIGKLFRGVKDREITEVDGFENGKFVYGFTPDKSVAKDFAIGRFDDGFDGIIGAKDIESFGGIIDPDRVDALMSGYAESLGSEDAKKFFEKYLFSHTDYYSQEKEYIVYDIKFKRDGDRFYAG